MRARDALAFALLAGCASAPRDDIRPEDLRLEASGAERLAGASEASARLSRAELEGTVRAGLGAFLANVTVSPALSRGRFVGWRIERARNLVRWTRAGLGIHMGDVVTRVNGGALERPDEALAVFNALREAAELRVELLREGQPLTITLPVRD